MTIAERRGADAGEPPDRKIPPLSRPEGRTDVANARRLVRKFGRDLRYVSEWRKFLVFDGVAWRVDHLGRALEMAKVISDDLWRDARTNGSTPDALKWAAASADARHVRAMLTLAATDREIAVSVSDLNPDPWLLCCDNVTVDLRTGKGRPHDRSDLITLRCPTTFDPDAFSDRWEGFVGEILDCRLDLVTWVQHLIGASLPGLVREHVLPVFHGSGANGKSTFLETIMRALGDDLAYKAPADLLLSKSGGSHPTDRAALFGKRLVVCTETGDGRRFDEPLVKELTGGDTITARRMREDYWSFPPSHQLVLCTNHRPRVRGTDNGIWRRLRLVPFDRTFAEKDQDKTLPETLRAEAPAVLNWAVRGCVEWATFGFPDCAAVESATADYRAEEDVIGRFVADACVTLPAAEVRASSFRDALAAWCEHEGEKMPGNREVGRYMAARYGKKLNNGTVYIGIGLRADHADRTDGRNLKSA